MRWVAGVDDQESMDHCGQMEIKKQAQSGNVLCLRAGNNAVLQMNMPQIHIHTCHIYSPIIVLAF